MSRFKDVVVCITGASSGIGEGLAYAFAHEGATLVLLARSMDKLNKVKAACANPQAVTIHSIDLSVYDKIEDQLSPVLDQCGPIDILINNAGISQRTTVAESTIAVDEKIMNLNYFGVVALTRLILPTMIKRASGHLVVISSLAGYISTSHRSAYAASKHAVRAWFDSLRSEVFKNNIYVTVVCPGYIKTNISVNAMNGSAEGYGKMDANQQNGMSVEDCCDQIINAIENKKNEILIGGKEKKFVLMRRLFPKIVEKKLRTLIPK